MTPSERPAYLDGSHDFRRGDVILVAFPFSERLAEKQRPGVVLSSAEYHAGTGDLIIGQITSKVDGLARPGDFRIERWRQAGLPLPSLFRFRVATLHHSRIRKRLGALDPRDLATLKKVAQLSLGL